MPRRMNPDQRDRTVVEAAWRVLTRDGLTALSVRNVAAEAGLPPSSLRYTFPTQASVRERAVEAVLDRLRHRVASIPDHPGGRRWAHAALLELLPLDDERRTEMEVTLALGAAAMTDPALRASFDSVNTVVRAVCAQAATALGLHEEADIDHLHALIDGLALHLVRRTRGASTDWALKVLDTHLPADDIAEPATNPRESP
ncbi:MAG: TetR/AcrR family transcriptional regulator [Kibdelosporangium sp.]